MEDNNNNMRDTAKNPEGRTGSNISYDNNKGDSRKKGAKRKRIIATRTVLEYRTHIGIAHLMPRESRIYENPFREENMRGEARNRR